jgi:uncharacterized protein
MLDALLKKHRKQFLLLCKTHQVKELYAFGSSITDNYTPDSDIDLIVEIDEPDPLNQGELLLSLWTELETLFDKEVDMLTIKSIKNPYLKQSIDSTKKLIYDGSKEEIVY